MALNKQCEDKSYLLGRWYACLEAAIREADLPAPTINANDWSLVATKPNFGMVSTQKKYFAILMDLPPKRREYYNTLIGEIVELLEPAIPEHSDKDFGWGFGIGYYHQLKYMDDLNKETEIK